MKTAIWKNTKRILLLALVLLSIFIINLVWFRPFFINHFYEKIFVEFAIDNPQMLTGMGLKVFYDELNDNSPEANQRNYQLLESDYAQLKQYDREDLEGQ